MGQRILIPRAAVAQLVTSGTSTEDPMTRLPVADGS